MSLDFRAQAVALAARFVPAQVTPPSGYGNIRSSSSAPPNKMGTLPCVVVFPPNSGNLEYFPGKRDSQHEWTIRFYYSQTQDITRDSTALESWLGVLLDQLRISTQLGGIVTSALITGYTVGYLEYASRQYAGIELTVETISNEGWAAVA